MARSRYCTCNYNFRFNQNYQNVRAADNEDGTDLLADETNAVKADETFSYAISLVSVRRCGNCVQMRYPVLRSLSHAKNKVWRYTALQFFPEHHTRFASARTIASTVTH